MLDNFWESIAPPVDISTHGHLIDWLFNYTTALNAIFFVLVCIGLFGFTAFYYHKWHPKAYYTYGNKKPHILITTAIGILVFLSIDMNITRMSNNDFTKVFINWPDESEDIVRVEVLAQQWMWNFRYAGNDGVFNTEDDVTTVNDLRLPKDKKVVFQILSKDVIHSFYIPNVRLKVDAIPGRMTRMWFEPVQTGEFDIACAEMCGTYHYRMQARMTVYTQEEYDQWMSEANQKALIASSADVEYSPDLYWGWKWQK